VNPPSSRTDFLFASALAPHGEWEKNPAVLRLQCEFPPSVRERDPAPRAHPLLRGRVRGAYFDLLYSSHTRLSTSMK